MMPDDRGGENLSLADIAGRIGSSPRAFLKPFKNAHKSQAKNARHKVNRSKAEQLRVQNDECYYCTRRLSLGNATWDHVIPKSKEGKRTPDNLVLACVDCNLLKGDAISGWYHKCQVGRD